MVNLAIIGFGELASSVHGPAIELLAGQARLAGLVELDAERRRAAVAKLPGIPVCDSLSELLSETSLEGILIATPPGSHSEIAVEAFHHGLAVYVEKPLADSREGGEQIVSSWRQAGTVGMVGFNYRFNSVIQDLRKALAREEVGPVVAVHSYFGLAVTDLPAWKRERATGGGALLDLASHHIDLLRFLLQTEVRAVDCQIWSDRTEDDNAMLTLTLESGIVAQLHASLSSVEEDRIEILGRNGKLIYDRYYSERLQRTGKSPGRVRRQLLLNRIASFVPGSDLRDKLRSPLREPSFPRSLAQFLEAITTGESRPPSIEDGWQCLRVILAAEEAHRLQRTQTLNS